MIGIKPRCFGTDNPWISYISFYVRHFHLICINHYLSKERCVSFRGRLSSSSRFYSTSSKYDWVWIGSGRTFIADIDSVTAKTEFLLKRMMITKFLRIKVSGKHGCITCPLKQWVRFQESRDSQMMFLKLSANPSLALLHQTYS